MKKFIKSIRFVINLYRKLNQKQREKLLSSGLVRD